jgi:hypothetical protein
MKPGCIFSLLRELKHKNGAIRRRFCADHEELGSGRQ